MINSRRICLDLRINSRPVAKFNGERTYVATGDSDDMAQAETATFYNRPSRANVAPMQNDVIFAKMANTDKTFLIDEKLSKNIYSTGFFDVSSTKILPRFLYYLIQSDEFDSYKNAYSEGTTQISISDKRLKNIKITYETDKNKQQQIVNYLDRKVGTIDKLITNIKQQIEDLENYRNSKIDELVFGRDTLNLTKGSSVRWLRKIPESWKLVKLKYISKIKGRIGFRGYTVQDLVEANEPGAAVVLGGTNIMKNGTISYDKLTYISEYKYFESPEIMLKGNEILITKVGAGTGENALYKFYTDRVTINPNVMLCIPDANQIPEFINFFLLSPTIRDIMSVESKKSGAQPAINQEFIKNLPIVYPAKQEQERIVQEINNITKAVLQLLQVKQQKIEELTKYKKSLIYECVTGKKEVLQ